MTQSHPSRLKEILAKPGAKAQVGRAVAGLLGVGILSIAILGILLIWHGVRRGRMIRQSQPPPRDVALPDLRLSDHSRDST